VLNRRKIMFLTQADDAGGGVGWLKPRGHVTLGHLCADGFASNG
jgi:hypothetical protein